jgi:hypothetical protein
VRSFPAATFERAILSCLHEIDPHAILNGDTAPDETTVLCGQLAHVEADLAAMKAFMDKERAEGKPWSPIVGGQITELEAQQRDLAGQLAEARQRAAHPLSEAWGEAQNLIEVLDSAPDPQAARLRLQSILRRIVSSIQLVVVKRGRVQLCAAQIWFNPSDRQRSYLILHKPAIANATMRIEGGWWVCSLDKIARLGPGDLRKPADARELEAFLSTLSVETLLAAME